ncbi:MAG: hypothetical protein K0S65_5508 [Labilithrix sp.]|nr:hypothetical protein [Labilithrix sp.]
MSQSDNVVKKSVTVNAPIQHAFDVFTRRIDLWWPRTHRIGKAEMKEAVLEGREGGRWFERGVDGGECEWGRVLSWEPPARVALSWHIDANWAYEPDPARASRVDVTFTDEGNGRTRVDLTHSGLDRHLGWEKVREAVASPGGWSGLLELFATKVAEADRYSS